MYNKEKTINELNQFIMEENYNGDICYFIKNNVIRLIFNTDAGMLLLKFININDNTLISVNKCLFSDIKNVLDKMYDEIELLIHMDNTYNSKPIDNDKIRNSPSCLSNVSIFPVVIGE